MVTFLQELTDRCRQIAARLVDAKASALASRLDELPARVMSLSLEQQPRFVLNELGQITLLCDAWFTGAQDSDVWRHVVSAEKRDDLLAQEGTFRQTSVWECVGEQVQTRRDGLVTQATWLLDIANPDTQFALLVDHFPAQLGKRHSLFNAGQQLTGEIIYYPSQKPLRAFFDTYEMMTKTQHQPWATNHQNIWNNHSAWLQAIPWVEESPCLLGQGKLYQRADQEYWWGDTAAEVFIP